MIAAMSPLLRRSLLFSSAASLLLCTFGGRASSQDAKPAAGGATALPEIRVTAPSSVQRRHVVPSPRPVRVARTASGRTRERAARTPPVVAAAAATAPQPGLLPIVTDQF